MTKAELKVAMHETGIAITDTFRDDGPTRYAAILVIVPVTREIAAEAIVWSNVPSDLVIETLQRLVDPTTGRRREHYKA
jgi:hypothetical protein